MTLPTSFAEKLQEFDQSHLLNHWDKLNSQEQALLIKQLDSLDFERLKELIELAFQQSSESVSPGIRQIEPLEATSVWRLPTDEKSKKNWDEARELGNSLLDSGKVGAILVAGGQGSRLGFEHPKGMFPIGPITDRSLFQIFFEQLLALSNRHGVRIPYFIMTSEATHQETEQFLEQHAWFGYPSEDVFLFQQGAWPAVDDQQGKILLASPGQLAMSPDGHGGLLPALKKAGLLEEMSNRGIEYLYYHQVDNPCARLCDPVMLGLHAAQGAEISTKVVAKRNSAEKVGVLAQLDGQQGIIEYSDLPYEYAEKTDSDGKLLYWAGNIAIHTFSRSLLERLTEAETSLPVHIAHKKVAYCDVSAAIHEPDAVNAYKFEQFIFDAIPLASSALVIETSREDEFQPVKNAAGDDSPESTRKALQRRAKRWLSQAGYVLEDEIPLEISPLIALDPTDITPELISELQSQPADPKGIVLAPEVDESEADDRT